MCRRTPRSTRPATRFPYTTLFRFPCNHASVRNPSMAMELPAVPWRRRKADCRSASILLPSSSRGYQGEEDRSEEHTSELQSLMRISYAVFCLKKKKQVQTCKNDYSIKQSINNEAQNTTHTKH